MSDLLRRVRASPGVPNHYFSELLLLRCFAVFESVIEDMSCKLVCGAQYCDGSIPNLRRPQPTRGRERALDAMQRFNRASPRYRLRWTRAADIAANLEELFPDNEHFVDTLRNYGNVISTVRKVRNHIAHRNAGTRVKFQEVVRQQYGANVSSITPGRLLVSPRFSPSLVEKWPLELRAIVRAAAKC